jgi:hypothetical protein
MNRIYHRFYAYQMKNMRPTQQSSNPAWITRALLDPAGC